MKEQGMNYTLHYILHLGQVILPLFKLLLTMVQKFIKGAKKDLMYSM
jgi:hypothetical protein